MSLPWVRKFCLALPGATEDVKWGHNLVFSVGAKMFAVTSLEPGEVALSFKCSPEVFAELVERPDIIPAPYLARAHWVALTDGEALPRRELEPLLRAAHGHVAAKLSSRTRQELGIDMSV